MGSCIEVQLAAASDQVLLTCAEAALACFVCVTRPAELAMASESAVVTEGSAAAVKSSAVTVAIKSAARPATEALLLSACLP